MSVNMYFRETRQVKYLTKYVTIHNEFSLNIINLVFTISEKIQWKITQLKESVLNDLLKFESCIDVQTWSSLRVAALEKIANFD